MVTVLMVIPRVALLGLGAAPRLGDVTPVRVIGVAAWLVGGC